MEFFKYHACGNDYIYIDCFKNKINDINILAKKISIRRFGIGSDGLILICPSEIADAKMRIFNSDGSEGKMCGNGIRCVSKYLFDERNINKHDIKIETLSGIKYTKILKSDGLISQIMVNMGLPEFNPQKIPAKFNFEKIINLKIEILKKNYNITCLSIGNPHCVIFEKNIKKIEIEIIGNAIQNCGKFPDGINVEFVEIINEEELTMRVWERGSGETLACGTGACASVIAGVLNGYVKSNFKIKVNLSGGIIYVNYNQTDVLMIGEAVKVYKGYLF
ncbi:MAG: diaminopimelate epimerase [Oscillospiraceae bacterium]|nr:diaminopimelate epimerase [Oscillospiraceae bacterium]